MVTTAHNRKMTAKDIFSLNPWKETDWQDKQEEFYQAALAKGLDKTEAYFESTKLVAEYYAQFPNLSQRQKAMAKVYPLKVSKGRLDFTEEEIKYILFKLEGTNDPHGLSVLEKLRNMAVS